MTRNVDPLQMRVGEAKQRDIGKKGARIGPDAMDYLQVTPGDVIQINAKKSTCAIVWPTDEDEKLLMEEYMAPGVEWIQYREWKE